MKRMKSNGTDMCLFEELLREAKSIYDMVDAKARRPYKWGSKAYLNSIDVGEEIEFNDDEHYSYRGLQQVAAQLRRSYGCQFRFTTYRSTGRRLIKRMR